MYVPSSHESHGEQCAEAWDTRVCGCWCECDVHVPNSFACHLSGEQSRLYEKRLAGLVSGLAFMCTHARISMHGEAASTQRLGAGEGSTVEPHRLHSATATPFSTGTPLGRVTLYTHSQHDSGPSTAPPQAELYGSLLCVKNCAHMPPLPLY
jgi:hypothetical protein